MARVTPKLIQWPIVRAPSPDSALAAALLAPLVAPLIMEASSAGQHHAPISAGTLKARTQSETHRLLLLPTTSSSSSSTCRYMARSEPLAGSTPILVPTHEDAEYSLVCVSVFA